MKEKEGSLGARRWISIVLIGLFGQIAWAIENNYINLWVYSQSHTTDHINWMTTASAVVATLTTFFLGALSDKLGKRRIFISAGYTIWGVFVFLFGVMSLSNMEALSGGAGAKALMLVGVFNVIVDCIMTFFGSTANDACFNAYVTDQTSKKNRPMVESVLSVLPLVSLAVMMLVGLGLGIPDATKSASEVAKPWFYFFLIFGVLTSAAGITSFFLLPKDTCLPNREEHYFKQMFVGFTPKKVKTNPLFYIALLAFLFFNIGVDSFMPYFLVYFQKMEAFQGMGFYAGLGIIIGIASLLTIVVGIFMEKIGKGKVLIPSVIFMAGGALGLFFSGDSFGLDCLFGTCMIAGYLLGTASLGASIRDYTPSEDVGSYQSVRMVFAVMLPMVIGSNLSSAVFQSGMVENEYGAMEKSPDKMMFLVTLGAALLSLIPIVWLLLASKKKQNTVKSEN